MEIFHHQVVKANLHSWQFSKLGKVMHHISNLEAGTKLPRNDEFRFKSRAQALVNRWLALKTWYDTDTLVDEATGAHGSESSDNEFALKNEVDDGTLAVINLPTKRITRLPTLVERYGPLIK